MSEGRNRHGFFGDAERSGSFASGRLHHHVYSERTSTQQHTHDYDLLYWVKSGRCRDKRRRSTILAGEGDLVFLPAGTPHATDWESDGRLLHIEVAPDTFPSFHFQESSRGSASRLARIEAELFEWDEISPSIIEQLVMTLDVSTASNRSQEPAWLALVEDYIRELGPRPLSLDEAANIASLHPTHLSRAFVSWRGITLSEEARLVRLRRAAARLRKEPNSRVGDIAAQEGFSDQSHFCRHFRRSFGRSPQSYRLRSSADGITSAKTLTTF